jgi:hypothetical protein
MRSADISAFVELLTLIASPIELVLFAIALISFIRSGNPTPARD